MMSRRDWLAQNHEELFNQSNATVNYLKPEVLARIGITGPVYTWYDTYFIRNHTAFVTAFLDWRNPAERTKAKTTTLVSTEKAFKPTYRQLYTGYLKNNPLVTDTDLVEMNLPKRSSGGKTPPAPPATVIEATTDTSKPGILGINYRDKNEKGTAKPKNVHGAELVWEILATPPADWSQLTHSVFDTRTPVELVFSGEQRGKTVYFALRWENNKGDKGPWSDIYNAIIP